MPIVQPRSLGAMGLVPFQINPHYADGQLYYREGGQFIPFRAETRAERINQYHEENAAPVVGLREGTALRVKGRVIEVFGGKPAVLFRQGQPPLEVTDGAELSALMRQPDAQPCAPAKHRVSRSIAHGRPLLVLPSPTLHFHISIRPIQKFLLLPS
jgi:hypothetical protein